LTVELEAETLFWHLGQFTVKEPVGTLASSIRNRELH